ncbi:MAG: hypothetical protein NC133_04290 [Prevotella sp.]|nr:hypothetical protein [Prevotella sp.]
MFNFGKYPELKPLHEKWNKLENKTYKAEGKFNKTNSEEDNNLWGKALKEWDVFMLEYAKAIYQILSEEKPDLFDLSKNSYVKWQDVFETESNIRRCVNLVEQSGGRWRLPPEFYK